MSDETPRPEPDLHALLDQLEGTLEAASGLDPDAHARLKELVAQGRESLEQQELPPERSRQILHRGLLGVLERFEGTHPDLAYAVGRVMDALSGLGI